MISARRIAVHTTAWTMYLCLSILIFSVQYGFANIIAEVPSSFILAIGFFYLHLYFLSLSFGKGKYWLHIPYLLITFGTFYIAKVAFLKLAFPLIFGYNSSSHDTSLLDLLPIFFGQSLTFIIFSTGYWYYRKQIRDNKAMLEAQQIKSELEKLELQNVAIRAQINPHFLINSLSHFLSSIANTNPDAADGVRAVMQFVQSSIPVVDKAGLIPLEDELDAIESLIHINRSRFPMAEIRYYRSVDDDLKIVPHVLAPFIENAFKHGKLSEPESVFDISIKTVDGDLYFSTFNKKSGRERKGNRGIGLKYVKQQLERAYKGRYQLNIDQTENDYTVSLTINSIVAHEKNNLLHS